VYILPLKFLLWHILCRIKMHEVAHCADQLHFALVLWILCLKINLPWPFVWVVCRFLKMQVGVFWNQLLYLLQKNKQIRNKLVVWKLRVKKVSCHVKTCLESVNHWIVCKFVEFIIHILHWLRLLTLHLSLVKITRLMLYILPLWCPNQTVANSKEMLKLSWVEKPCVSVCSSCNRLDH
jgi:hypothetical protein